MHRRGAKRTEEARTATENRCETAEGMRSPGAGAPFIMVRMLNSARAGAAAARRRLLTGLALGALAAMTATPALPRTLPIVTAADANQNLLTAAAAGDVPAIERALAAGADIEARDARGRTPVLLATSGAHVAAAQALMRRGANVNAQDEQRDSAFLLAGARGLTEIVRAALAAGADWRITNRYGGTALIPACERGHVDTVRLLLTTDIDVDHVNRLGWTGLLEAVILADGGPRHQAIVRLLLARGAQVNLADRDGVTPLQHAERLGQREVAALLRAAGGK